LPYLCPIIHEKIKAMEVNYKILGVNDDKDFCSCCGKQGLKRVVWLEDNRNGEVNHFGTHCAALLLLPNGAKSAKANVVEKLALIELRKIVNGAAEKHWSVRPYRAFVCAIGKELVDLGVENRFDFIAAKTDAFCNFIWPYQKYLSRANELGIPLDEYIAISF